MAGRDLKATTLLRRVERIAQRADRAHRRHTWLAVPIAVVRKFGDDRAGHWAALIAYYGFFSLFPLLLVFVTVLGFLIQDRPDLQEQILRSALAQFPIIGTQIERNVHALTGSAWALGLGIAGAVWSGLGIVTTVQGAMDEIWNVPRRDRPPFLKTRLEALAALAAFGTATILAGLLAGFGTNGGWAGPALRAVALAGTFALNVAVFASAFRFLTEADITWRDVLPGALMAAVAWMVLLVIGSWIVDRQIRGATEVYGFFAIVIGLLGWIYLAAQVVLFSAEVNVVLRRRLWPRSVVDAPPPTEPDHRALAGEATEEATRPEETIEVRFDPEAQDGRQERREA
ncbi:MAG TPA: YihY/virulence factor BrkB family protein [Actinomycetota bacterium]|nr:YihY/virulence factor BrkB family protein [Actinomycetota bacterium]